MLLAIPVYNEASSLREVFSEILDHLPEQIQAIVAIDDGSTDGSAEILDELSKEQSIIFVRHHRQNHGYGCAMIESMKIAQKHGYSHLITMDCDRQHRPEDLIRFLNVDPDIDVVSGSRYLPESRRQGHAPEDRVEINSRITARLNRRYGWSLTDSFCGFKRYKMERIDPALFSETGYAFPMEFWPYCQGKGLKIQELAVSRIYTTDSRSFGEDLDRRRRRYRYYLNTFRKAEKKFQVRGSRA
ncbi:MAG: dolichyl-phosphate mannose synthase [Spirochaetaceae bacterium]|nr:dolichyl-phosphate mannose synthase [Spirochaetaceae bacterium]|tara:strand:+ start:6831 stop:7559 length:729 start_codon:yes stop_codon:yes gene_type:complete